MSKVTWFSAELVMSVRCSSETPCQTCLRRRRVVEVQYVIFSSPHRASGLDTLLISFVALARSLSSLRDIPLERRLKRVCCVQYRHYVASLDIFLLKPSKDSQSFGELVTFIAQVQTPVLA
jgi:hypothetical protein